jgi:transcriptional regulator with XRE-family HTH domain
MPGVKRTRAQILGRQRALEMAARTGREVALARKRRKLTQAALARVTGVSRPRLSDIEAGRGGGAPLDLWFALAEALGRYLRFEFARDPMSELVDAGHLAIQELVITVAKAARWEVQFEATSRSWGSGRSVDVRLVDRKQRRVAIVECWNTFGDLGAAARSSNEKVRDAEQRAVAIAGGGDPFEVGLVWVVRDTHANRALVAKYEQIFVAKFPGSSARWVGAIVNRTEPPREPGLVWCDTKASRLFARRQPGSAARR